MALVDGAAAMFFNNNNNHKQELTASGLNTNDDEAKRAFVEAAEQNKSSNLINTSSLNLKVITRKNFLNIKRHKNIILLAHMI